MWENRSGHGFASMGISNPPSWTVSLPSEPSQILQLQEPPQVFEGLPLPNSIEVDSIYLRQCLKKSLGGNYTVYNIGDY